MTLDFDLWEDLSDSAGPVDYDRRTLDAHICDTVKLFLFPDPIGVGQPVAFIDQQVVGQCVFRPELPVGFGAVRAYSKDDSIQFPEPGKGVAKVARLTRSARGVVFGIEEEDDFSPAQRCQGDSGALVSFQVELGCRLADFNHSSVLKLSRRGRQGLKPVDERRQEGTNLGENGHGIH